MRLTVWLLAGLMVIGLAAVFAPPADNAEAYGYGVRPIDIAHDRIAPPAIFLDPIANGSIDATHDGFKPQYAVVGQSGWQSTSSLPGCGGTGRWCNWNALVFPGPDPSTGRVELDNANDGWYQISVSMDLPPDNATGWYKLELWIAVANSAAWSAYHDITLTMICNAGGGFAEQAWPYFRHGNSETPYTVSKDTIEPLGPEGGTYWYGCLNNSPLTGLPWTKADFGTYWSIWLDYDYNFCTSATIISYLYGALIPTTAPEVVEGQEILRPDGDIETFDWTAIGDTPFNDCINETTTYGDGDTTYITTSSGYTSSGFTFSDPSTDFASGSYNLTLWVIAKSSEEDARDRQISVGLTSGYYAPDTQTTPLTSAYHNWTFSYPFNPGTGQPWTYSELVDLKIFFESLGNMSITQVGVMLYDSNYVAPGEDSEGGLFDFKMVSADGIISMLAVLGFFGMIATPTISYLQYKNGDEALLAGAHGIYLMVLFFGLFLIGLMAQ
jgi:hypothetical protein